MSPLREALARLVGDQLVNSLEQRGFWVAPLSLEELDDISRVRNLVETEALRLSIENGDDAWEQQVRNAFTALSEVESELPVSWTPASHEYRKSGLTGKSGAVGDDLGGPGIVTKKK